MKFLLDGPDRSLVQAFREGFDYAENWNRTAHFYGWDAAKIKTPHFLRRVYVGWLWLRDDARYRLSFWIAP